MACPLTGKLQSKSIAKAEHNGRNVSDQTEIESCLLEVNKAKTQASAETLFLVEPLVSKFGFRNNTNKAEHVLNGTCVPPLNTGVHAAETLKGPQQPMESHHNQPSFRPRQCISTDDHIESWK